MARNILDILAGVGDDNQLKTAAAKIGHEPEQPNPSDAGLEGEIGAQMGSTAMDSRAKLQEKALQAAGDQLDARTWQDPREVLTAQAVAPMGTQNVAPSDTGRNMRDTKTSLPSTVVKAANLKNMGKYIAGKVRKAGDVVSSAKNKAVTKGGDAARSARSKATQAGMTARSHKGAIGAAAGAGAAGAAGGYAMGRKKSASLAEYHDALCQEDGEKVASERFSAPEIADLESQALTGMFMGRAAALGQIKEAAGK